MSHILFFVWWGSTEALFELKCTASTGPIKKQNTRLHQGHLKLSSRRKLTHCWAIFSWSGKALVCLRCAVGSRPPAGVRLPPQQQQQPTMLRPTVPCASVCYAGLQGCATYRTGCCCSAIAALSWPEHGAADAFTTSTTTESFHYQPVQIHTCILIQNHTCHLYAKMLLRVFEYFLQNVVTTKAAKPV